MLHKGFISRSLWTQWLYVTCYFQSFWKEIQDWHSEIFQCDSEILLNKLPLKTYCLMTSVPGLPSCKETLYAKVGFSRNPCWIRWAYIVQNFAHPSHWLSSVSLAEACNDSLIMFMPWFSAFVSDLSSMLCKNNQMDEPLLTALICAPLFSIVVGVCG